MFAGKSLGSGGADCVAGGVGSFIAGSGGNSGMAGTAGMPSFASVVAAGEPVFGGDVVAAGAGGVVAGAADGHAGAPVSAASDVPFVPVNGGTPSGDCPVAFAPVRVGTGPSLILMYKMTPAIPRIVIVMSGRIEPIDRPP
jgi:hypothetical protein